MVFGLIATNTPSLTSLIDSSGIKITRQSLHEHFNQEAVVFLQQILTHIQQLCISNKRIDVYLLKHFKRVLIYDSSWWKVHKKLSRIFPGFGGVTSEALCKLQLGYDYLRGHIESFAITKGTKNDASYSDELVERTGKKDLILVDLGYFSTGFFSKINDKGAYFISKLKTGVKILEPITGKEINLVKALKKTLCTEFESNIILYSEKSGDRIKCRLIGARVPKEVAEKRRRKHKKTAKSKGSTPKKDSLFLCGWTLMITNVSEKILPTEKVFDLYMIRWQIELVFKQFKSTLQIDKVTSKDKNRLLCEIYGRLIAAIVITTIHGFLNSKMLKEKGVEVSLEKFFKRFQERVFMLMGVLLISLKKTIFFLYKEIKKCLGNCIKLKQRSRLTSLERVNYANKVGFSKLNLCKLTLLT